ARGPAAVHPAPGAGSERRGCGGAVAGREWRPVRLRRGELRVNDKRPPLRPLDDALQALLAHANLLAGTDTVATFQADGRVLAEDLVSPLQVPPQDNSSMDGYAVRRGEIADEGVVLAVSQRIAAGAAARPLQPGTIARIFTGAPVPAGADAIVMQEDTETLDDGRVRILRVPSEAQWIRRSGED